MRKKRITALHKRKISCKHKRSRHTFTKNSNYAKAKAHYIDECCKILRKVIKEVKKQGNSRFIAKSNNKIKITWNLTKKNTGKFPTLLVNDEK
jgi:hypothetical protein